jgi:aminoglycoside phosphotransferase
VPDSLAPPPGPAPADAELPDVLRLECHLGAEVSAAAAVPWGDRRSTWRLDLADGQAVAAQRFAPPDAARRAARVVMVMDRLAAAGIAVPHPARVVADAGSAWLTTPWIPGRTAAALLESDRAGELARAMGDLGRALAAVDVGDLDLSGPWDDPASLRVAAEGWLATMADDLGHAATTELRRAVDRMTADREPAMPAGPDGPGLRHGDFAPINMLLRRDGRLVLVDFEHARRSVLPVDVAWWTWVVGYHHPAAWDRVGPTFLAAAGSDDSPAARGQLADLALLQLLERAAAASAGGRDAERRRWIERVGATLSRHPR